MRSGRHWSRTLGLVGGGLILVWITGCGGRTINSAADASAGAAADGATSGAPNKRSDAGASTCVLPPGPVCFDDGDCAPDERCDGCQSGSCCLDGCDRCYGVCKIDNAACLEGVWPPLQVTLSRQGNKVVAHLRNLGCKPIYRAVGCCGEGDPLIESRSCNGSWSTASCKSLPGPCCDAEPTCQVLEPGGEEYVWVPWLEPDTGFCEGSAFRVGIRWTFSPSCLEADPQPTPMATSDPLLLGPDACEPGGA